MVKNSGHSILVVDDDHDAGQNLGDILTDLGYQVDIATDPLVALKMAQEKNYDIALLDLKMPGMDGLTLARKLKEQRCSTILILTTAYANQDTLATAQRDGIWRVFSKPLDLQHVIPSLSEASRQPLVLLIEDDEDLCYSLTDLLQDQGYRVHFATEIDEALRCVRGSEFQVVLIDMRLPGGFGDEVCAKVRGISDQVRVVLSTGHRQEMEQRIQSALGAGADAVCYKPFQMAELLTTLQRLTTSLPPDSA